MAKESVDDFVESIVGDDLHAKRVLSIRNGVLGIIHSSTLAIASIGTGLAAANGLRKKHSTKQVDRLLSNKKFENHELFASWVPYIIGDRKELVVALDWTEFAKDNQTTIAIYLVTNHGRATPLVWKTHRVEDLYATRNDYEDELLRILLQSLPYGIFVTIIADRGFGDQNLYTYIKEEFGWDYAIRFKGNIMVTDEDDESRAAKYWLSPSGRAKKMSNVFVTKNKTPVPAVLLVKSKKMKDPWFIATSRDDLSATQLTKLYGRRFTIEETFRDIKDHRFGMGLSMTRIKNPDRRDRLLFLAAMSQVLFTMLGAASEKSGYDKYLKTNTSKKRTHSLYHQGQLVYAMIPNMRRSDLIPIIEAFEEILISTRITKEVYGVV